MTTPSSGRLAGKTAVITGAGSGIGKAIAERFAAEGARVAILDLTAEAAATAPGGQARAYAVDVTASSAVAATLAQVAADFGRIDILINNAGVAAIGNVEACSEADFERVYQVNVKGAFHILKHGIPQLLAGGGGSIINIASIASLIGIPDRFAYSMSKGAIHTMTLSVATDYVGKGIRCNCIAPARIHTPFVDGFLATHYAGKEAEMFAKLSATQPIGRMGRPDEVAHLAVYLASDESAFVTGSCFPLDGGFTGCRT